MILVVHTYHKYEGIDRRGRDDDPFGLILRVGPSLLHGGEDTIRLHDILSRCSNSTSRLVLSIKVLFKCQDSKGYIGTFTESSASWNLYKHVQCMQSSYGKPNGSRSKMWMRLSTCMAALQLTVAPVPEDPISSHRHSCRQNTSAHQ